MTRLEFESAMWQIEHKKSNEIKAIEDRAKAEIAELAKKFATDNNDIPLGSIISDFVSQIKVDKCEPIINPSGMQLPFMGYEGYVVYKNGKELQLSPARKIVLQTNVRKVNGNRYTHIAK